MLNLLIEGKTKQYPEGITYLQLAEEYQHCYENDILLAVADNRLYELRKTVEESAEIRFITADSPVGMRTYRSSVTLLALKALRDILGKADAQRAIVDFSISTGYYIHFAGKRAVTDELLQRLESRMRELVRENIPFEKSSIHVEEAVKHFQEQGELDKARLFRYRRSSRMNLYRLEDFEDYYYGYLTFSTGYLKYFSLHRYQEGFVLQMPVAADPKHVPAFAPTDKLFQVMKTSTDWSEKLNCSNVGELNDLISSGKMGDLIQVQEALMEKNIGDIAEQILRQPSKKIVMIAGPSSSGKTTFSHRLSVQLRAHGVKPHPIAADNYFVDREKSPRDANGNYDFEDLLALDLKLFNEDMKKLLRGEEILLPTYNFMTGKREYRGNMLHLGEDELLVIEGIHCLNDAMSYDLPADSKFRIYVSALTTLNLDDHNRIPTTDGRLLRRMVRDARTRGNSAKDTIRMWQSVRRGEERNIFPYQEQTDAMFNSALLYELAVLKQYAEPLLFGIYPEEEEYQEAKRLLKFLNYFLGIDSENIPNNSIVREFIGGSCFDA